MVFYVQCHTDSFYTEETYATKRSIMLIIWYLFSRQSFLVSCSGCPHPIIYGNAWVCWKNDKNNTYFFPAVQATRGYWGSRSKTAGNKAGSTAVWKITCICGNITAVMFYDDVWVTHKRDFSKGYACIFQQTCAFKTTHKYESPKVAISLPFFFKQETRGPWYSDWPFRNMKQNTTLWPMAR